MGDKKLTATQVKVLAEKRNNPNITKSQLQILCNLEKTSIDKTVSTLKTYEYIERIGSNKAGYWKVKIE